MGDLPNYLILKFVVRKMRPIPLQIIKYEDIKLYNNVRNSKRIRLVCSIFHALAFYV
jgi:hypothetical protein